MAVAAESGTDTRSRILRESEHLFMEHGYAAVSMSQICAKCKLTKPGVYYHFHDKDDLYAQVVLGVMGRARSMLENATTGGQNLRERVEATVRVLVLIASQNMDQVRRDMVEHLVYKDEDNTRRPKPQQALLERSFFDDMVGPIQELMVTAHRRGELRPDVRPEHAAKALLALTNSFIDRSGPWAAPVAEVPHLVASMLLDGFAA